ncbi:MAG: hypothetical protein A2X32_11880 [Elusimicrobia bacterium GWC2_64_44]|nr:MAG: hypothetical protein A2X32_11880 [Elusimicrobia bacterium GWC2_64_44]
MNGKTGKTASFWPTARRSGQLLLPSLLIIPSLLLFVYLLFETTKVSREKIRQQFATDSAAFIQMGDYTNLLNRTAYVNGAFPYRIFKEAYECPPENPMQMSSGSGEKCPYDMLYEAGAFPKSKSDVKGTQPSALDGEKKWEIAFDDSVRPEFTNNPTSKQDKGQFDLITQDQGVKVMLEWGTAIGYYKFYSQVYSLLGSVEESQYTVFERLTDNFNFFRKSYYLNANTAACVQNPQSCGNDGVYSQGGFKSSSATLRKGNGFYMHYVLKIMFYAKVFTGGSLPPYYLGKTNPPMDMTSMTPDGLFQLATVTDDRLLKFRDGIDVYQGWDAPANYFNVDLNTLGKCKETGRPCVHSLVTSQCPQMGSGNNCVWPNPTPKYQTRLYP